MGKAATVEYEGSWEEMLARASEWVGRRVRLTVLPEGGEAAEGANHPEPFWASPDPDEVFADQGIGPVADVDAFLRSLPHPQDTESLWEMVSADRAERRAAAEDAAC